MPPDTPATHLGHSDSDVNPRGRRIPCPCCGHRVTLRGGQVWKQKGTDQSIRIVSAERDGAIVEQVGREHVESRWGVSYNMHPGMTGYCLLRDFELVKP